MHGLFRARLLYSGSLRNAWTISSCAASVSNPRRSLGEARESGGTGEGLRRRGGMAVRSLRCMVRMAVREGTFSSSPGIYGLRNALSHVHGSPMLDAALPGFVGSRGIHSRAAQTAQTVRPRAGYSQGIVVQGSLGMAAGKGARRLHILRDVITAHADGAFTAMTVAAFSVFAGVWYWMKDTDKADKAVLMGGEDPAMKTDAYLRRVQAEADLKRAMESYDEAVVEDIDDDPAMRARFDDWIKKYGRTYKDEAEKARRFKIFKAFARSVDVNNAEAAESGSTVQYGLTKFADWNSQEVRSLCCSETTDWNSQEVRSFCCSETKRG